MPYTLLHPCQENFTKTKGRDRGASYIEVDFTPIIPTPIPVISHQHEDDFNLVGGADHEGLMRSITYNDKHP